MSRPRPLMSRLGVGEVLVHVAEGRRSNRRSSYALEHPGEIADVVAEGGTVEVTGDAQRAVRTQRGPSADPLSRDRVDNGLHLPGHAELDDPRSDLVDQTLWSVHRDQPSAIED